MTLDPTLGTITSGRPEPLKLLSVVDHIWSALDSLWPYQRRTERILYEQMLRTECAMVHVPWDVKVNTSGNTRGLEL